LTASVGASVVDPDSGPDPASCILIPHLVLVSRLDPKADPGRKKYSQKSEEMYDFEVLF
jgi:hypothetical protein